MQTLEEYELIDEGFEVCRLAFATAAHDSRNAFNPIFNFILKHYPIHLGKNEDGSDVVHVNAFPSGEGLIEFDILCKNLLEAYSDAACYAHDLRVESQNLLLGDIFDGRANQRKPLDEKLMVIDFDKNKVAELKKYFEEDSSLGKHKKKTEEDVLADIKK